MADGHAVAEASILVMPVNLAGNIESAVSTLFSPVMTDGDGKFELTTLRPGAYTIAANSPGYVLSDQDAHSFFRPGDNATLTLVKGGVITGKVTNLSGDPVVGAIVRAIKVREADDGPPRIRGGVIAQMSQAMTELLGPYKTDDRGIYRIFGLSPGIYQVAAGGRGAQGFSFGGANGYDADAPTYYPSSTLETAADVTVPAGAEAGNIDIRYRENHGSSISGTVTASNGAMSQGSSVLLTRANNGVVEGTTTILTSRSPDRFAFDSVLDGEYVVTAMGSLANLMTQDGPGISLSQSQRVTVRGADVTGIDLKLEPLGSIEGRAVLEPLQDARQKAECKGLTNTPLEGVVLSARDQRKQAALDPVAITMSEFKNTTPNEKGEFTIKLLRAGVQRVDIGLPGEYLYVKSMALPPADPNAKPIDAAKNGINLKSGDKAKGLVVTLSEGAAAMRGRVVIGNDDKAPATKMRVHLIPAEPETANEVLRYYEAEALTDGSFSVMNVAPGKYWLIARELSDQEQSEPDRRPAAWDAGARVALRFEGEAGKKVIELSRCQRIADYVLTYTPLTKPTKPPAKNSSVHLTPHRLKTFVAACFNH